MTFKFEFKSLYPCTLRILYKEDIIFYEHEFDWIANRKIKPSSSAFAMMKENLLDKIDYEIKWQQDDDDHWYKITYSSKYDVLSFSNVNRKNIHCTMFCVPLEYCSNVCETFHKIAKFVKQEEDLDLEEELNST